MCASLSAKGSSRLGRSGTLNIGSTLSERRYLRTVFRDSPVRRAISRIEKCCRYRQRRMTLNNSMSITPRSPAMAEGERFEHGSVLDGKTRAARVSSQWKSTPSEHLVRFLSLIGSLEIREIAIPKSVSCRAESARAAAPSARALTRRGSEFRLAASEPELWKNLV